MKWPHCVTRIGIPKLFKILMVLASLKLLVLGAYSLENVLLLAPESENQAGQEIAQQAQDKEKQVPVKASLHTSKLAHAQDSEQNQAAKDSDLSKERKELIERRKKLERREKELKQLEQEIDQKLTNLQETEARLQNLVEKAEAVQDEKIKHLVDVYSNMKAQRAAQVLETISEEIAVKVLSGMRGRQAGEILTHVNSEKAAMLSEALTEMQTPFAD